MTGVRKLEVAAEDAEVRLDRWFARHFPALGHGRLQKLLRTGQIRVDGRRVRAGLRLQAGQVVRVPPISAPAATAERPPPIIDAADRRLIESCVLYQDDELVVLDKPAGLAVQGGTGQSRHLDALAAVLARRDGTAPRLVHRLDKDTSGLLVLARTAPAARWLTAAFRNRQAGKTYWAVVAGVPSPDRGVIDLAVAKQAGAGGERVGADPGAGKRAVTRYETLDQAGSVAAWLALYPETGRTHQLRVHCAVLGSPILGDRKYGGVGAVIAGLSAGTRLHLHARALALPRPDGTTLRLRAPLPAHMRTTFGELGFDRNRAGEAGEP